MLQHRALQSILWSFVTTRGPLSRFASELIAGSGALATATVSLWSSVKIVAAVGVTCGAMRFLKLVVRLRLGFPVTPTKPLNIEVLIAVVTAVMMRLN
jgi:hypothetical protein